MYFYIDNIIHINRSIRMQCSTLAKKNYYALDEQLLLIVITKTNLHTEIWYSMRLFQFANAVITFTVNLILSKGPLSGLVVLTMDLCLLIFYQQQSLFISGGLVIVLWESTQLNS